MKKETKKEVLGYLATTAFLYLFTLVFSLFSMIFILDKIPKPVQFIVSFVFMAPLFYMAYTQGASSGAKMYKTAAKVSLGEIHGAQAIHTPIYKCIFHVIGYVVPLFIVFIIACCAKLQMLRLVGLAFTFPVLLLFSSVKVVRTSAAAPIDLAVFLPYILLLAGMFVLGYVRRVMRLKRQHAEIQSELRSFDN